MADNWNIYRIGRAASATTAKGQITQYGLAFDLGTAQWQNADEFNTAVRDFAERNARQELMKSQEVNAAIQDELSLAVSYQNSHGLLALTQGDQARLQAQGEADKTGPHPGFGSMLMDAPGDIMAALGVAKGAARTAFTDVGGAAAYAANLAGVADNISPGQSPEDLYQEYKDAGGLLSRQQFQGYETRTQQFLISHLQATSTIGDVLNAPGVKHLLAGINAGYRAVQTPFIVASNRDPGAFPGLDPNWFSPSEWSRAWRESQDQSLGNAIVNSMIQPYAGQDRVDEWRKNSSLYQLTSLGAEVGAGWYLDPGVIAGKAAGGAARLARGEMPLRETSGLYVATKQGLQREQITVRGPLGKLGEIRAGQLQNNWHKVKAFAQTRPYHEFADLPMFRKRDLDGQSAAAALYYAFRESPEGPSQGILNLIPEQDRTYTSLEELSQQLMVGDPKAYAQLNAMKKATPQELQKFAPGAQSYIDAIEATKTKATQLQKEADELAAAKTYSPFHEWSVHTEVEQRYRDILDANDQLAKYQGYTDWLTNASREPEINRIHNRHFFMDGPYGRPHIFQKWTRPIWLQKANVMPMHDVDMGAESIRRQFLQFEHLMGYKNPDGLTEALQRWQNAPTNYERYQVAMDVEERHLIQAAAEKFKADPGVIYGIYRKIIDEQNKVYDGIFQGNQSIFSTAPDLASRLDDGQNVNLVSHNPDTGMVTLELMDNGRRVTTTVHESALEPKVRPVDPTQTPNYYQPIDTRRFYLELKRNQEIVQDMSLARAGGAAVADLIDAAGTRFNTLWKPLQLFRFGWPQRVLMDENARALAILGIPAFTRHYGEAYGKAAANVATAPVRRGLDYFQKKAINGYNGLVDFSISNPRIAGKVGRDRFPVGPGPLRDETLRTMDPVAYDAQKIEAPLVPEPWMPRVDQARLKGINGHATAWDDYERGLLKHKMWLRQYHDIKEAETLESPATHVQGQAYRQGAVAAVEPPARPKHPLYTILSKREGDTKTPLQTVAYDPVLGKRVTTGLVVPVKHTKVRVPDDWKAGDRTGLEDWYYQNRELLASKNHRVVITPDGHMYVARHFDKRSRAAALNYMQFMDSWADELGKGVRYTHKKVLPPAEPDLDQLIADAERANGELRAQEHAVEDVNPDDLFDFTIDTVSSKLARHRDIGKGHVRVRSSDGREFTMPDAYAGHDGDLLRGLVSSQGAIEQLYDGHGAALSLFRRKALGHRAYNPPAEQAMKKGTKEYAQAVEYFHKWSDLLNTQIAHSPIWNKMLNGWSDERIVNWLDHTPEGAAVKREVMDPNHTTELWVNEHRAKLDYYLPSKKHQRLLAKGRLEPSTLRREIHPDERPSVFGPDVEFLDKRTGLGRIASQVADRVWHYLGTAPIDAFSRHPFAKAMYDLKMRSLIGTHDSKWLTPETLDRFERQARNYARQQVRRHLWDLTDATNFTDALRFIAPFWGAQQEALTKWLRIVSDRPETVARAFNLQRAVYNNFAIVDKDGQLVDSREYFSYNPEDRVVVRIPEIMRHTPLGKALETIGTVGIPIGSANTVLQGEMPLLPGPGPIVTIPADKFLRATSDTYGTEWDQNKVYRWLFPIGRPQHGGVKGVLDQVLPGWGKRVMQAQDQDGVAYANLYTQVANEMNLEAQKAHKPAPTPEEIQTRVHFVEGLRIFTGLFAPVQMQYRPKHQFLIDAAHKYQKDYGVDWFDKFMQDYGESVARYAASSSNSPVGLPPTSQGMEEWSQNKSLIAKYPQWGGAIVSPDAYKDDFNSDAYYAQFGINVGPGDDTPLRESLSTRERFASADAKAGWYEYRKVDAMLDAELEARGLHSINQSGAEDLLAMKKNFVADLSKRLPAWREEYDNYNNDIYARVNELQQWAFDKQFDGRPDIQGVRQYLIIRDQVAQELDRYAATTGGSRSLQSQENTGLRNWFYDQVGQLVQQNPAFAEFYSRYLGSDTLEQGSGQ